MDDFDPRLIDVFFDVQSGLPRQGPGNKESTLRALKRCEELPDFSAILDIGCGPGMQTLDLAEATKGSTIALDNCSEYLDQLAKRLENAGLTNRVEVQNKDMANLNFAENSFDLIWCEGAAYNIGVPKALELWKPILNENGYLAFTELVWLEENPDKAVAEFFQSEYPAMTNLDSNREIIRKAGYELVDDFTLPDSVWWDDYYTPLESKLPSLKEKYRDDEQALEIVANTETEIDMRRRFPNAYGYQFFITKKSNH